MLKNLSLSVMVFSYLFAGTAHFTRFQYFLGLTPSFFPHPDLLVNLSGALEILLAFFLVFRATRRWACYGILFLLSVSLPIDGWVLYLGGAGIPLPFWILIARIPFHLLLMAWAFWHSLSSSRKP